MSADQWVICPKCHKRWKRPEDPYAYGKVSEEEYLKHKDYPKPDLEEPQSLAIYEEIDMDENGILSVLVHGSCRDCNFKFRFERSQRYKV